MLLLPTDYSDGQERHITIASRTGNYRDYARLHLSNTQWKCLDELWQRESSWRTQPNPHLKENRSSKAYGIPQALPAKKMASAGIDYQVNPITQVRWGLDYIKKRYKTPCNALAHHNRKNWY